ncbi:hypothetical protein EMCRGX_G008923 [Ephydatia muelleri]
MSCSGCYEFENTNPGPQHSGRVSTSKVSLHEDMSPGPQIEVLDQKIRLLSARPSSNNPDILDQLQCPLCLAIIRRPLELLCRVFVCTDCMVRWFMASNCPGVKCLNNGHSVGSFPKETSTTPVGRTYGLVSTELTK